MKFNYLETFRGIMAVWVVIYHGLGFINFKSENLVYKFINYGFLPVLAFTILSGFVTHVLLDKKETFYLYIKRRFLRLFPVYLFCFFISLLMLDFSKDTLLNLPYQTDVNLNRINLINDAYKFYELNIFSHLSLLHGLFPNNFFPFTYTIMGQSWSLTLEWQFYLFIPFLYGLIYLKERKIINLVVVSFFAISVPLAYYYMPQRSFLPYMIQYFLLGFLSYPLFLSYLKNNKNYIFLFLSFLILIFIKFDIYISIIIFFWAILLYLQKKNYLKKIFENKFLLHLGKISYSLYCIHMIVYIFVIFLLQKLNINLIKYSFIIIPITLIISIILSNYTYKYIEVKFIKKGKRTVN